MPRVFSIQFLVLIISFCIYGTIGFFFAYNTKLVYHPHYICDLYFGFDNALHDTSFVRHPLLKVISIVLKKLFSGLSDSSIGFILVFICSGLLAIQNLFLYKILKLIIGLSNKVSLIICLIFLGFGSNLLLSFTFDSYVFTTCFLMVLLYYFFKADKNKEPFDFKIILFSFLVGGITITNYFKVILLIFFSSVRRCYLSVALLISTAFGIVYFLILVALLLRLILFLHTSTKVVFRIICNIFLVEYF